MAQNPPAAPFLFDRALLKRRQDRARKLGPASFLLDRVAEDMEERLAAVNRSFADVAEFWTPGEGSLPRARFSPLTRIALADSLDEALPLRPESLDLVISALALQFVNDLPGVLAQIRRALRPDGLLLAAMIGGDTLTELRQSFAAAESECEGGVSPRVAPFADLRDVGALLQRVGFALPVTDVDRIVVRYDDALALMADLRRMGATSILLERRRTPTRRTTMLRMAHELGFHTGPAEAGSDTSHVIIELGLKFAERAAELREDIRAEREQLANADPCEGRARGPARGQYRPTGSRRPRIGAGRRLHEQEGRAPVRERGLANPTEFVDARTVDVSLSLGVRRIFRDGSTSMMSSASAQPKNE